MPEQQKCPNCKKLVLDEDATLCKFCGTTFSDPQSRWGAKKKSETTYFNDA